jgi:hypothetical protein
MGITPRRAFIFDEMFGVSAVDEDASGDEVVK